MTKKKENKNEGKIGLAATVVGALAAGYYLYGPKGTENRKKISAWSLKAKAEVLEKFEKTKEVTDETYEQAVDKVTAKYAKMKSVGEEEADKLNRELKRHWRAIKRAAKEEEAAEASKKKK